MKAGWRETTIGECVTPVRTLDPEKALGDNEFEYVDLSAVDQQSKTIVRPTLTKGTDAPGRARQIVAAGDVLVSTVRPNLNAVARVGQELDGAIASTGFCVLRPTPELDSGYLFQWVRSASFVAEMVRQATGASYPAVSDRIVRASRLPLPPVDEQRPIAHLLDAGASLLAKRSRTLDRLGELGDANFVASFGDPRAPGSHWETRRLGEVTRLYSGATLPIGQGFAGQTDGAFLMKVSDMNVPGNDQVIHSCALWAEHPGPRASTCPPGSVVLPKRGAAISTNKKRIVQRTTTLDPNLMAVAPDDRYLTTEYLFAWFTRLDLATITSGTSVPQLNKQDLAPLTIAIPPQEQQRAFQREQQSLGQLRASCETQLRHLSTLFAALQHRAFAGAL